MRIVACLLVWSFSFSLLAAQPKTTPYLLKEIGRSVQGELDALQTDLERLAKEWAGQSEGDLAKLPEREVRRELQSLVKRHSLVTNASLISASGILTYLEPAKFRSFEGKSIATQPQFQRLIATGRPVLGQPMRMIEGMEAMDLEVPIRTLDGRVLGSVSAIIEPQKLLAQFQDTLLKNMPFRLTLLQTNGRILFSSFGDPIFSNIQSATTQASPATREWINRILAQPQGNGILDLNTADSTDDHAVYWISLGLHGTELRLVLLSDASRSVPEGRVNRAAQLAVLQKLAASPGMAGAILRRDPAVLDDEFIRFIQQNPGIYSVQAIDARGIVFAGQPIGGVPLGYRFSLKRAGDHAAFKLLGAGKAGQYEAVLLEGGVGLFTLVPVPGSKGAFLLSLVRFP